MNTSTGAIGSFEALSAHMTPDEVERFVRPIDVSALSQLNQRRLKLTGQAHVHRNSFCPCGSGKKFKKCCMDPA